VQLQCGPWAGSYLHDWMGHLRFRPAYRRHRFTHQGGSSFCDRVVERDGGQMLPARSVAPWRPLPYRFIRRSCGLSDNGNLASPAVRAAAPERSEMKTTLQNCILLILLSAIAAAPQTPHFRFERQVFLSGTGPHRLAP